MYIPEDQPGLFHDPAKQSHGWRSPESSNGSQSRIKNYVIDTNVLLHDPHSVYRFADNHVWIPIDVLGELDRFKNEQSERGANARTVHRFLSRCFNQNSKLVVRGAKTPGGGTIRIAISELLASAKLSDDQRKFQQVFRDLDNPEHRILALCLDIKSKRPERAILVTKDLNMQLKALAIGVEAQDYESGKVEVTDVEDYRQRTVNVDAHSLQRFASSRQLTLDRKAATGLFLNEYVLLSAGDDKLVPARHVGDGLVKRLTLPPSLTNPRGAHIKPMNLGQQCFLDALLDPDIALVTCYGQAGTGKTLLAVAAGLHLFWSQIFGGMTVSRPVVAMGDTLGFLPGTLNEKMKPWLQSIYDAFELVLPANIPSDTFKKHKKQVDPVQSGGVVQLKPQELLLEKGTVELAAH